MQQGDNSTHSKTKLKTPGNIGENPEHGIKDGPHPFVSQILADLGANHLDPPHLNLSGTVRLFQGFGNLHGNPLQFTGGALNADKELIAVVPKALNNRATEIKGRQSIVDFYSTCLTFKLDLNQSPPGKINPVMGTTMANQRSKADQNKHQRNNERKLAFANKINIDTRLNELHAVFLLIYSTA